MNSKVKQSYRLSLWLGVFLAVLVTGTLRGSIDGVSGASFALTARGDYITTGDGNQMYCWGYALDPGAMQYPGPTLILAQNVPVTVTLKNALPPLAGNVSFVIPGMVVTAAGGLAGALTREAPPDGTTTVTYTFTPTRPGTYMYYSGTRLELQVEMGLLGAIIVRPTGFDPLHPRAYEHADTAYERETLFLCTEMDPRIHLLVDAKLRQVPAVDPYLALAATDFLSDYFPNYFFFNGRSAPDTMENPYEMANQPYNCLPIVHPGERLLARVVDCGNTQHAFHFHAAHLRIIARDGHLLTSGDPGPAGPGPDLGNLMYTNATIPGQTLDAIFRWVGITGWDIYGTDPAHMAVPLVDANLDGFDDTTWEYIADHGKPIPVTLPETSNLVNGPFWSGSPYLGATGVLPPGEGGLNPWAAYTYMWHSHTEKELTNWGLYPGGMLTMLFVVPNSVTIP